MSRKPSGPKHPVSLAIIAMRKELGITQMKLAHMLGLALSTVARWETFDPPRGKTLSNIALWAEGRRLNAAEELKHLKDEDSCAFLPAYVRVETPEEKDRVMNLLRTMRQLRRQERQEQHSSAAPAPRH